MRFPSSCGFCLIISTPRGKNWLYNWYLKGTNPNDKYISFKGISTDNPYADIEFINSCQQSFPESVFKQEFMAEFTDSGNDVFTHLDNACIRRQSTPANSSTTYYAGVDIGISKDYTVCTILDESGRVVNYYRDTGRTFDEYSRAITNLLQRYNPRNTFVEVNGVGYGLYELINKQFKVTAWTTNNENKTSGIQKIIYDLENLVLELPSKEWEPAYFNELQAYSYTMSPTGKLQFNAPSGFSDGCVMSLMLANEARHQRTIRNQIYIGKRR